MAEAFDNFPGLEAKQREGDRAVALLEQAVEVLKKDEPDEDWHSRGTRIRGATTIVHAAALELGTLAGWHEAAHAAVLGGVLEGQERDDVDR